MIKKYTAEIWVIVDKEMPEKYIRESIQNGDAETWSSEGHFKVNRICKLKEVIK